MNYQHLMPTHYTLNVDLKDVVTVDVLQIKDKKVAACKIIKERFEKRFKTRKLGDSLQNLGFEDFVGIVVFKVL
ncbi:hypothetical protein DITRI_Ditri03aG0043300 [Diplodiscus trichospermus]